MDAPNLNRQQLTFIEEYLISYNATRAAIAAGYSQKNADVQGCKLLANTAVKQEIERRLEARAKLNALTVADLLDELRSIVKADPRDLMEYRRGACRYCYGAGHLYQRTPAEYDADLRAYLESKAGKADPLGLKFPVQGGVGYRRSVQPHPDCPECEGEGIGYSFVKDSRKLPRSAARLFAGIKETREGLEIKTRGQDKLLELAMKHLGMLAEKLPEDQEAPQPVAISYQVVDGRKPQ